MAATAFDTLKTADDLKAAGIEEPHARAIASAIAARDAQASTKSDLEALEARIAERIADAKFTMLATMVGVVIAANGVLFALLKLTP